MRTHVRKPDANWSFDQTVWISDCQWCNLQVLLPLLRSKYSYKIDLYPARYTFPQTSFVYPKSNISWNTNSNPPSISPISNIEVTPLVQASPHNDIASSPGVTHIWTDPKQSDLYAFFVPLSATSWVGPERTNVPVSLCFEESPRLCEGASRFAEDRRDSIFLGRWNMHCSMGPTLLIFPTRWRTVDRIVKK